MSKDIYNKIYLDLPDERRYLPTFLLNSKWEVDFNIVDKMPELLNMEASSHNIIDIYSYLSKSNKLPYIEVLNLPVISLIQKIDPDFKEQLYPQLEHFDGNPIRGKRLVDNYLIYGAPTWYEWCLNHWGCKWNARKTTILPGHKILFITPDKMPLNWFNRIVEIYQKPIIMEYVSEDYYHGMVSYDGECIKIEEVIKISAKEYKKFLHM